MDTVFCVTRIFAPLHSWFPSSLHLLTAIPSCKLIVLFLAGANAPFLLLFSVYLLNYIISCNNLFQSSANCQNLFHSCLVPVLNTWSMTIPGHPSFPAILQNKEASWSSTLCGVGKFPYILSIIANCACYKIFALLNVWRDRINKYSYSNSYTFLLLNCRNNQNYRGMIYDRQSWRA